MKQMNSRGPQRPGAPGGNPNSMQAPMAQFRQKNKNQVRKKNNPLGKSKVIDYLDGRFLGRFINDQGKILPRRITGLNAFQQRQISQAIRYARHLAILPFVASDLK